MAAPFAEAFFDAEECSGSSADCSPIGGTRRRWSTDFPDTLAVAQVLGPWRATEVEQRDNDAWLLLGRRHSVDERRDAMEQGKALFLRLLAARADGAWRSSTADRAEELQALEDDIVGSLDRQSQALRASRDFWLSRHASDSAYLEHLGRCAGAAAAAPLPQGHAQQEAEWRKSIQAAAERSEAWARQLPLLLVEHEEASGDVRQRVAGALAEAAELSGAVRAARAEVWPPLATCSGLRQAAGKHVPDSGPEGICLWSAVRRYLYTCDALQRAQVVALARVRRDQKRVRRLQAWVDKALGRSEAASCASTAPGSPGSLASSPPASPPSEPASEPQFLNVSSEDGDSPDPNMDLSALVVHEQDVSLLHDCELREAHVLLSVDLWLHVWLGSGAPPPGSAPLLSLPLPRACLRPVAEPCPEDPQVLRFNLCPPRAPSLLRSVGHLLARTSELVVPKELTLQCEGAAAAAELLSALELVEKLYPLVQ